MMVVVQSLMRARRAVRGFSVHVCVGVPFIKGLARAQLRSSSPRR